MAVREFPIAVVGISARVPGAQSCHDLWELLVTGKHCEASFPPERSSDVHHILSAFRDHLVDEKNPFLAGSYFKSINEFDCSFFSFNHKEALHIEPEQRIFLETLWSLFEDSGYSCKIRGTRTGVYVCSTASKYKYILSEDVSNDHPLLLSSRVSRMFDLLGPSMMLPIGYSSLSAVHLPVRASYLGSVK